MGYLASMLALLVVASAGCADHGDCVPFSTCDAYDGEVSVSVHDAVTGAEVTPMFEVDSAAVTAQCNCTGCLAPGYTGTCGEWTLLFTSRAASDQTYQVVVSAAGYAAQQFSLTVEYGNYQCESSSCQAPALPMKTIDLEPQ